MELKLKLLAALVGIAFASVVVMSLRRSQIRPGFAWLWLLIAGFLTSIPLLEAFYKWIASGLIGLDDARTIIYVPLIGFLLIYSFYLTLVISRLSDRIQELITHTAILESQIRGTTLERDVGQSAHGRGRANSHVDG